MKFDIQKPILFICIQFLSSLAISQKKDTIFFNHSWEICDRSAASYYRIGTAMQLDSFVFYAGPVRDYYLNDTLQMEGVYSNEGYKDGIFSFYYPDGILKAQGNFTHNAMYGPWKYYYSNGFLKAIVHYAGDESSFIVLD